MALKLRPKGSNDPYYNPLRDLAYCYPQAVENVVTKFNEHRWPELEQLVATEGVTFDNLCDAMDAYVTFLNEAHKDPSEQLRDVMARTGWLSQPKGAQIAIMAMLGSVVTGQLFHAIRDESTPEDQMHEVASLYASMQEAKKWMYASPWTVRVRLFVSRVLNGLRRRGRK